VRATKRQLAFVFVFAVTAVLPAGRALAGDLDGIWERDDKKCYGICDDGGIQVFNEGEYGCRLGMTRTAEGRLEWHLRFSRTADEGGYFETKATSTLAFKGAVPAKLDMDFEWVEVDAQGTVTGRGTERHGMRRGQPFKAAEAAEIRATLAYQKEIDERLAAKDPAGGLAVARKAFADPAIRKNELIGARLNALEKALEPAHEPAAPLDPNVVPLEVSFVGLVPLERMPADFGKWAANMSVKNLSGERVAEVELGLRYQDASGRDLDETHSIHRSFIPEIKPGASFEKAMGDHVPEETKKVVAEVQVVKFASGREWKAPVLPESTENDPADRVPAALEFARFSTSRTGPVARMRITSSSRRRIMAIDARLHWVDADGKDLCEPSVQSVACPFEIEPRSVHFANVYAPLPAGTKSIRAEIVSVTYPDLKTWFAPRAN
jgi:hypothetical protein